MTLPLLDVRGLSVEFPLRRQRLQARKPSQRSIGGLNDLLLSCILRFLSHHADYTGHAGSKASTDHSRLKVSGLQLLSSFALSLFALSLSALSSLSSLST